MESSDKKTEYTIERKKEYIQLLNKLINKISSKKDKLVAVLDIVTKDNNEINKILHKYVNSVNSSDKNKKMLVNKNSKLFHNSSKSTQHITLIPSLNLKKILDGSDDETQNIIWYYAQLFYVNYNTQHTQYMDEITKQLETNDQTKQTTLDGLNMDNVVLDIANTFKQVTKNGDSSVNPFESIVKTTQIISEKYQDKLTPQNCSINEIFNSVKKVLGNGENGPLPKDFDPSALLGSLMNTGQEDSAGNMADLGKLMGSLMNTGQGDCNMPDLSKLMGSLTGDASGLGNLFANMNGNNGNNANNMPQLTDQQLAELEEFYRNNDVNKLMEEMKKK